MQHVAVLDDVALALGAQQAALRPAHSRDQGYGAVRCGCPVCHTEIKGLWSTRSSMLPHITSASDLVTDHDSVRAGFLEQALAKTQRAEPFIAQAREFQAALAGVEGIDQLSAITVKSIQSALLAAAGFSDKAQMHLTAAELQAGLAEVLARIVETNPDDWRAELVFRFMLTKGDALGGSIRNLIGARAGIRLTQAVIDALERRGIQLLETRITRKGKIAALIWPDRRLLFDARPPGMDKNVDAILLDTRRFTPASRPRYQLIDILACGELKGGIDPAGADEHWKTAGSAIERLRSRLHDHPPRLFFVGAAIAPAMAKEIFDDLESGRLDFAANLTVPQQLADLADWLVSL
jgi:hypothetical protein